jgi:hypothetical protein
MQFIPIARVKLTRPRPRSQPRVRMRQDK